MSAEDVISKVLTLIKASGWQTAAGAAALGVVWRLIVIKAIPTPDPLYVVLIVLLFFCCLFLSVSSILASAFGLFQHWLRNFLITKKLEWRVEKDIPFMTQLEREIIGYLLHHKLKVFEADVGGGNAASLIGRGFVVILAQHRQMLDLTRVPMAVPDPVWRVWERHKDKFPYAPLLTGIETQPWRISVWAR